MKRFVSSDTDRGGIVVDSKTCKVVVTCRLASMAEYIARLMNEDNDQHLQRVAESSGVVFTEQH